MTDLPCMTLLTAIRKIRARAHDLTERFAVNCRGTTAIIFATALIPLIAAAGATIDYIRSSNVRVQLQAATDAAAMAGAVSRVQTIAGRRAAAEKSFDANIAAVNHGATVVRQALPGTGTITVTATAAVPTSFMRALNLNSVTVNATSTVASGGKKLELAIVLDTTGSMNFDGKLDDLKAALPTILDIVMPPGNTDTRVALIPFATYVNVGTTGTHLLTGRADPYKTKRCVLERKNGPRPNEDPPTNTVDEFWILTNNSTCAGTKPITPLTNDRATLDAALEGLTAAGATSGHLGIQWGWHTISPLWAGRWPTPSTPAAYTDNQTLKAIVILTDGNFTEFHIRANKTNASCDGSSDCALSRSEAKAYCDAIKSKVDSLGNEAVMVFTIGFGLEPVDTLPGINARDTMKYCASYDKNDPETDLSLRAKHFYFPVTEADLEAAFSAIGNAVEEAISKPRFSN